ncbi:MAG: hypothetical protein IT378_27140 [Sandaracinaceae bacterium]|nr:hypothetical protein [Sandaracinaceae bacterium]
MTRALRFRVVVDRKDPTRYARWVRKLAGRNGAYVLRDRESGEVLYVGESHSRRLRGTLTRHFQAWTGYQAGTLYSRHAVEAALVKLDGEPREVAAAQAELIRALSPRDNVHHRRRAGDATDFDPSTFDRPAEPDPSEFSDEGW